MNLYHQNVSFAHFYHCILQTFTTHMWHCALIPCNILEQARSYAVAIYNYPMLAEKNSNPGVC